MKKVLALVLALMMLVAGSALAATRTEAAQSIADYFTDLGSDFIKEARYDEEADTLIIVCVQGNDFDQIKRGYENEELAKQLSSTGLAMDVLLKSLIEDTGIKDLNVLQVIVSSDGIPFYMSCNHVNESWILGFE